MDTGVEGAMSQRLTDGSAQAVGRMQLFLAKEGYGSRFAWQDEELVLVTSKWELPSPEDARGSLLLCWSLL